MIDINQPVKQGHDFVLNNDDGTQELGTGEEFAKRKEAGTLRGIHTEPALAPHNEVEHVPEPADKLNEPKPKQSKKAKAKEPEMSDDKTKLENEQDNEAAEDRTKGEVEQTEEMREEEGKAPEPNTDNAPKPE